MPHVFRPLLATTLRRTWGRIAAWATVVFGVLQVLFLPLPALRTAEGRWEFYPSTLVLLALTALAAWGAFRGLWIAFAVLALVGAGRAVFLAVSAARMISAGYAPAAELVPLLVTLPFAAAWTGALVDALLARRRERRMGHAPAA
ncbi:MAG TPA: hypothetical protein VFH27_00745 [Longimicrobiaceae bacterium]|nr:hypothetical protein [Longimicrobiaceae bacterium]